MWWWGEQELPGLQGFVDDSVKNYTAATVKPMLQDTAVVISQFQTAAAAGNAPDIQYLWNGIYHMESVWLGYLQALDGLVSDDVLKASQPTLLSHYDGHIYRMGWYPLPMIWIYNKDLFEKARLDPDTAPATWDDFLAACDKLKSAGISPVGGGIQDGYWGEWYLGHAIAQNVDTPGQAVELFTGERDFEDPKYHEPWARLEELKKHDFLNPEMSSTGALSGHRPDRHRQAGDGRVDRRAHAEGQRDHEGPDRRDGDAGLRKGQDRREADLRHPGPRHLQGLQGPEGGRRVPRISAIARTAVGL